MIKAAAERIDITTRKARANDKLYAKVLLLQGTLNTVALISVDYISLGGEICSIGDEFFPRLQKSLAEKGVSQLLCGCILCYYTIHWVRPQALKELALRQSRKIKFAFLVLLFN